MNALGLEMLAREEISSPAVTAVKAPEGMNAGDIINGMLRTTICNCRRAGEFEGKDL